MAYQFGRLPQDLDFPANIRKQYFWLYIPILSWIMLIFPLFFFPLPIPLGPLVFGFFPSTTRRKMILIYHRCDLALQKEPRVYSHAMDRWMADVGVNLLDILSLGLSNAFSLAKCYDAMMVSRNDDAIRTEENAVRWLTRWLLLGNVFFLVAYILCPGLILEQILYRLERHLFRQYKPMNERIENFLGSVTCQTVTTIEELDQLSNNSPVLLYCRSCLPEAEENIRVQLKDIALNLFPDLVAENIQIGFCNTMVGSLNHSRNLLKAYKNMFIGDGFLLFSEGRLISKRTLTISQTCDTECLTNIARQTIGVPESAEFPRGRVDPPGILLQSREEVLTLSGSKPVLILTFSGGKHMNGFNILAIREEVIPQIREGLKSRGIALYYTNSSHANDPDLVQWMKELNLRTRGFLYLRGGSVEKTKSFGGFSVWSTVVKDLMPIIGISTPAMNVMATLRYYVITSPDEAKRISRRQPLIVVSRPSVDSTKPIKETYKDVLPDLVPAIEAKGGLVAIYQGTPMAERWAKQGVTLLEDGSVIKNISVKTELGDGYYYSEAGKELANLLTKSDKPIEGEPLLF